MIIKYFGRHEYEELEKIISSVDDLKDDDINFIHTDIPEIYDDLTMRAKLVLETQRALMESKKIYAMQDVRDAYRVSHHRNGWLTSWRAWRNFVEEIKTDTTIYKADDLFEALYSTELIIAIESIYFQNSGKERLRFNPLLKVPNGLDTYRYIEPHEKIDIDKCLSKDEYILFDVCKKIISNTFDSDVDRKAVYKAIQNLFFYEPHKRKNVEEVDNDEDCFNLDELIQERFSKKYAICKNKNMLAFGEIENVIDEIIERGNQIISERPKELTNKSLERIKVVHFMAPIIGAMCRYSNDFPLIRCFEKFFEKDIEKIPQELDENRFVLKEDSNHSQSAKVLKWINGLSVAIKYKELLNQLYTKDNNQEIDLSKDYLVFAYRLISGIVEEPRKQVNGRVIDKEISRDSKIHNYSTEKLFGFFYIQEVACITYKSLQKEILDEESEWYKKDLRDAFYEILNTRFEQVVKCIYKGYGVYSRIRVAREYIPKFIKEVIAISQRESPGFFASELSSIDEIKEINNTFKKKESDFLHAWLDDRNSSKIESDLKKNDDFESKEKKELTEFYKKIELKFKSKISSNRYQLVKIVDDEYISWIVDFIYSDSLFQSMDISPKKLGLILHEIRFWITYAVIASSKAFIEIE